MKKLALLIPLLFLMACEKQAPKVEIEVLQDEVNVSDSEEFVCGRDKVKDADGNEYKTAYFDADGGHDVTKEGQCWMAENLNVGTKILNSGEEPSDNGVIEKYPNDQYSWAEAMNYSLDEPQGICPIGWLIPSEKDWKILQKSTTQEFSSWNLGDIFYRDFESSLTNATSDEEIIKLAKKQREEASFFLEETKEDLSWLAAEPLKYGEMNLMLNGYWDAERQVEENENIQSYWMTRWCDGYYALNNMRIRLTPDKYLDFVSEKDLKTYLLENITGVNIRKRLGLFYSVEYVLDSQMFPVEYGFSSYHYLPVSLNVRCVKK
ncbi:MAG: fibrobacter succinogenes major paralogous domain-containing protein [Bacteroidales bacterium]|nr:fibrobacter succinogenes major paralogous domain-containing protein [Bacteroidales bacterium]